MNRFYTLWIALLLGGCAGQRLTENTRYMQFGMSPAEVENVLGEPELVSGQDGMTLWSYRLLVQDDPSARAVGYYVLFRDGKATKFGEDKEATYTEALRRSRAAGFERPLMPLDIHCADCGRDPYGRFCPPGRPFGWDSF